MQFHYNAAFKCLNSTTKTQGKDVKFVPGGVGGVRGEGNCSEGSYLGVIAQRVVVLCKCPGSKSPGGYCLVGNFSRTIAGEQLSRDLVDISMDISGG